MNFPPRMVIVTLELNFLTNLCVKLNQLHE